MNNTIVVLGAGAWGTSIAITLAKNGHNVLLWTNDIIHYESMLKNRCNNEFLPNYDFPDNLKLVSNLDVCKSNKNIIIAVPSAVFVSLIQKIYKFINDQHHIISISKGLVKDQFQSEILDSYLPINCKIGFLSGPTFAQELVNCIPSGFVLSSKFPMYNFIELLENKNIFVKKSDDIIGVQLGGAIKNVFSICLGISNGLKYGTNTNSILFTYGLDELIKLGLILGDLYLTSSDNLSRNRRFGLMIAQGYSIEEATKKIGNVVEGIDAAKCIYLISKKNNIDMPITRQIYSILYENVSPNTAIQKLISIIKNKK
jgi:glycerol-3-phosphate dehydrogenase (NAD(P)+)